MMVNNFLEINVQSFLLLSTSHSEWYPIGSDSCPTFITITISTLNFISFFLPSYKTNKDGNVIMERESIH